MKVSRDMTCPFCSLPPERILIDRSLVVAFEDAYPISPGHVLVIPRRHVRSFFDLTADEQGELLLVLNEVRHHCISERHPDGFNIGVNDGPAAGQTVPHMHMHLIPRYAGDRADPRGGVRWIIPEKADYWSGR